MKIYEVQDRTSIAPLFAGWQESFIWSYLQGCMGGAQAAGTEEPVSARIISGDFCFLGGRPEEGLLENLPGEAEKEFLILVPQNESWSALIEQIYGGRAVRRDRYAVKKEGDIFDRAKLKAIVGSIEPTCELRMIDEELFYRIKELEWARDLCSQFQNYEDYRTGGIGAVILERGEIVSGASSYIVYRDGIEIEVDTREDRRRNGFALICSAKLILKCLERGFYPSWDAHNPGSLALAEKLGYHYDRTYPVYEITV